MEPLDPAFIEQLKSKPEAPKRQSRKGPSFKDRSWDNWWKFHHHLSEQCSFCPRVRTCARLSEDPIVYICRFCFLEEKGM